MRQPREIFVGALVLAGLAELAMIPVIEVPVAAAVFALGFLTIAASLRRRMRLVPAVLGLLLLVVDGGGTPTYQRTSWVDWVVQLTFAAVCVVGVVSGIAAIRVHRRARTAYATAG
jgi:hypothetical protein